VAAILLLFPGTIEIGALPGLGVMAGATIADRFILRHDVVHSTMPAVIFAIIAWTLRSQLPQAIGLGDRASWLRKSG